MLRGWERERDRRAGGVFVQGAKLGAKDAASEGRKECVPSAKGGSSVACGWVEGKERVSDSPLFCMPRDCASTKSDLPPPNRTRSRSAGHPSRTPRQLDTRMYLSHRERLSQVEQETGLDVSE